MLGGQGYQLVNVPALVFSVAVVFSASLAGAQEPVDAAIYDRCLAKAEVDPETAYAEGLAWFEAGGGIPARHCVAVSLVGMRAYDEAAARLEVLAGEVAADRFDLYLGLLAQAAQAWLLSGRAARAEALQTEALAIAPNDPQLRVDRAVTRLTLGRQWDAIDDLDVAIDLDPKDPETRLYRASAYRYLDVLDLAADDVAYALDLDPSRPEAWLEQGILRSLAGDRTGARSAWLQVLRLSSEGPAASAARARLEAMDVRQN